MFKKMIMFAAVAGLVLALAGTGQAAVIPATDGVNTDWMVIDSATSFDDASGAFAKVGFGGVPNEHDSWAGNSWHDSPSGTGDDTATWTFKGLTNGIYEVAVSWSATGNRPTNAPYSIDGGTPILVDQTAFATDLTLTATSGPSHNDVFDRISTTALVSDGDLSVVLSDNGVDGYPIADAVGIRWLAIPEPATLMLIAVGVPLMLRRKSKIRPATADADAWRA